jgi:hypothetical protein
MHGDEGAIGLLRAQHDESVGRAAFEALRHQAGSGARRRQGVGEFAALDECKIIRPGKIERCDIRNQVRKSLSVRAFGSGERNDVAYRQA